MRVLALVAVVLALAGGPALAAPTIDIKAQTSLGLDKVRLRGDGIAEVTGQLVDKLTGDGIGGQTVTIKIGDDYVTATTSPDGRFRALISVPPHQSLDD